MAGASAQGWRRYIRPTTANRTLWLLCLMYFIYYIDRVNLSTAGPLIPRDLGLTQEQLGIAFGIFARPYTVFQLWDRITAHAGNRSIDCTPTGLDA